ncbi:MAG: glycine--tRNA ligase [Candidatus Improbicoccus pseudotrichonymphae]|uniref:Glycine--tRNA ligase n=1 Tax=Candidatus Improbicoccus pseudotrichonymphae TaxID=3033792 RepID=A0AA48IH58_9FIRM|nr:MAG: glycine--tRNA ligase [Candidatus Improbicoccus pseudotrichonymphae]
MNKVSFEQIVSLCKIRGFIFQGSEIYGGLANTWDYGPLGSRLKNNLKDAWRKKFIQERSNSYELDSAILMHPRVWEASGHVESFSDPLIDCKKCKIRSRADNLIENAGLSGNSLGNDEMFELIKSNGIKCPSCGECDFTEIREFNLMFETYRGTTNDKKSIVYLRPENAQGEYINFANVQRSMRCKLPFGIGQIGKAFRNEITPGNFTFRTIEFEQMEYQTFCKKGFDTELYDYFKKYGMNFFEEIGIPKTLLRFHDHEKLAHYAKAACDIEFLFPFGWGEINGTHNRTDYDLSRHQQYSKKSMEYLDSETNEKFIPYIIESTYGVDRIFLALICSAYAEEEVNGDTRKILKLNHKIAPYKAAILPLSKNLSSKAYEIYKDLSRMCMCDYDEAGSIGKRYRRQDEIGTPLCVTYDFDSETDGKMTIRQRDSMIQERIDISELKNYMSNYLKR